MESISIKRLGSRPRYEKTRPALWMSVALDSGYCRGITRFMQTLATLRSTRFCNKHATVGLLKFRAQHLHAASAWKRNQAICFDQPGASHLNTVDSKRFKNRILSRLRQTELFLEKGIKQIPVGKAIVRLRLQ